MPDLLATASLPKANVINLQNSHQLIGGANPMPTRLHFYKSPNPLHLRETNTNQCSLSLCFSAAL